MKNVDDVILATIVRDLIMAWRVLGKRDEDRVLIADRIIEFFEEGERKDAMQHGKQS